MDKPKIKKPTNKKKKKVEKPDLVRTRFGDVIKNMESKEKKALDQLLLSATEESRHNTLPESVLGEGKGRQLPQHDIKKDHLLIKGINLSKNMQTGEWTINQIDTNQGKFGTGEQQTARLDQKFIRQLVQYLKLSFEEDLKAFLKGEDDEV